MLKSDPLHSGPPPSAKSKLLKNSFRLKIARGGFNSILTNVPIIESSRRAGSEGPDAFIGLKSTMGVERRSDKLNGVQPRICTFYIDRETLKNERFGPVMLTGKMMIFCLIYLPIMGVAMVHLSRRPHPI